MDAAQERSNILNLRIALSEDRSDLGPMLQAPVPFCPSAVHAVHANFTDVKENPAGKPAGSPKTFF
ncbi:hypothetical protein [Nitratireductor thuwali]|uniref:Uncharacterized protein n=1 Tax=Nitratireductor thuwali TaxID=2267699 RepID=A0ABY5MLY2_9HYPH|nr:hypothetical protein NTH_03470 [Nitratireductor thuwali]